jgi:carbon storage regulator CsrA
VLTRKAGEGIYITLGNTQVYLKFLGIENGGGRIGIQAPKHVKIMREELLDEPREERRGA